MNLTRPEVNSADRVRFRIRLLVYFAVWVLAALAFQVFLQPESLAETDQTPIQQRLIWLPSTPIMAVVGLAHAFALPAFPEAPAGFAAAACFLLQAILALSRAGCRSLIVLSSAQVLMLTVAVVYFVHLSELPSGG